MALTPGLTTIPLTINFRNSKAIAKVVSILGRNDTEPWDACPEDFEPITAKCRNPQRDRRAISELVEKLLKREGIVEDQIVVLTPHRKKSSCLKGCEELGGARLSEDPIDRDKCVLHATLGGFKGLESDVVILADIDLADERASRRARYVASSRARHLLYVWSNGDWQDPDADSVLSER